MFITLHGDVTAGGGIAMQIAVDHIISIEAGQDGYTHLIIVEWNVPFIVKETLEEIEALIEEARYQVIVTTRARHIRFSREDRNYE